MFVRPKSSSLNNSTSLKSLVRNTKPFTRNQGGKSRAWSANETTSPARNAFGRAYQEHVSPSHVASEHGTFAEATSDSKGQSTSKIKSLSRRKQWLIATLLAVLLGVVALNYYNYLHDWALAFVVLPLLPVIIGSSIKPRRLLGVFIFWALAAGGISAIRLFTTNVQFNSFSGVDVLLVIAVAEVMTLGALVSSAASNKLLKLVMGLIFIGAALAFWLCMLLVFGNFLVSGTFISVESILAIMQTNLAEGWEYLSCHAGTGLALTVIVAVIGTLVFSVWLGLGVKEQTQVSYKTLLVCLLIAILSVCCLKNRNFVYRAGLETVKYVSSFTAFKAHAAERAQNLQNLAVTSKAKPGVYVLVIGESATRNHMGAYGYSRNTTPWLSQMAKNPKSGTVLFDNVYSCHTQTVQVLTYALTRQNQYNTVTPGENYSLIEVAKKAGFKTVWLSNQQKYGAFDTPLALMAQSADQGMWLNSELMGYQFSSHLDSDLLPYFDKIKYDDKMLIIVHLIGSHEQYEQRIPKDRTPFGTEQYVDLYDNTISFTDEVLQKIYARVTQIPNFEAMVYVSDHGEYAEKRSGHNFNLFHPAMTRIPFVVFAGPKFMSEQATNFKRLQEVRHHYFTNDLLYNFMLNLTGVTTSVDESENSILSPLYNNDQSRFRVGYNRYKLDEMASSAQK